MNLRQGERTMKKIAVMFPGVGYHIDKPLLYYSKKIALEKGYDIVEIQYGEMPTGIKMDKAKRREAIGRVMSFIEEQLAKIDFTVYDEVVFISKSIGSVGAMNYSKSHHLGARQIIYTPIEETLENVERDRECIWFHGTNDDWCETRSISESSLFLDRECIHMIEGVNHSLECEDTLKNLEILVDVMKKTSVFLR